MTGRVPLGRRQALALALFLALADLTAGAAGGATATAGAASPATIPTAGGGSKTILICLSGTASEALYRSFLFSFGLEIDRLAPFVRTYVRELDFMRNPGAAALDTLASYVRNGPAPDLIVLVDQGAPNLFAGHLRDYAPEAPVVSTGIVTPSDFGPERKVVYVREPGIVVGAVDLALSLFPSTRKIVFAVTVSGDAERADFADYLMSRIAPVHPGLKLEVITERKASALSSRLKAQPPDTVVAFGSALYDDSGNLLSHGAMVDCAKEAGLPVFGLVAPFVEAGAIGGHVVDYGARGAETARIAVDLLSEREVPDRVSAAVKDLFNWAELQRYGISLARLPEGSLFHGRPEPLFVRYSREVFIVATALALLFAASVIAFVNRNWRLKAARRNAALLEEAVARRTEELAVANEELSVSNENLANALRRIEADQASLLKAESAEASRRLAARVAHELNTPLGAILASTRGIKGTAERWLSESPAFLRAADAATLDLARRLAASSHGNMGGIGLERHRLVADLASRLAPRFPEATEAMAESLADLGVAPDSGLLAELLDRPDPRGLIEEAERRATLVGFADVIEVAAGKAADRVGDLKEYLGPSQGAGAGTAAQK